MLFYPPASPSYPASPLFQTVRPACCPQLQNYFPLNAPMPLTQPPVANPSKRFEVQLHAPAPLIPKQPGWLNLQIYDPLTGRPPSSLKIVHEKPAHIFIVNQDFSDFQHVHPEPLRPGEAVQPGLLHIPVNFKAPGQYKLFMQFTTPEHGEHTLSKPFQLGGVAPPLKPMMPDNWQWKTVDGYNFRVTGLPTRQQPMGMFKIDVFKNGQPVRNIQPFLGAGAHGVILSQDGRSFIHTHPMTEPKNGLYQSPIGFHTHIDQPGLYKMWIQTQIGGQLRTVDWTFQV